jgi:gamma-tubulin complex component 3
MGFESGLNSGGGLDEAHAVWEKKYVFVKKMVPGFVSEEFGKKVRFCLGLDGAGLRR